MLRFSEKFSPRSPIETFRWQWCWWHRYVGDFMTDFRCWLQNQYTDLPILGNRPSDSRYFWWSAFEHQLICASGEYHKRTNTISLIVVKCSEIATWRERNARTENITDLMFFRRLIMATSRIFGSKIRIFFDLVIRFSVFLRSFWW